MRRLMQLNKQNSRGFTLYLRMRQAKSAGFTLIELLTVIAIIAILTGLFTVSYLSVRQRGRDAQRKSDIKQLQSALELYRADNDSYPPTSTFQPYTCASAFTNNGVTYMNKLPCDPNSTSSNVINYYYYQLSSTSYVIASCLENTSDKDGISGTTPQASTPSPWPTAPLWPLSSFFGTNCSSNYYFISSNP